MTYSKLQQRQQQQQQPPAYALEPMYATIDEGMYIPPVGKPPPDGYYLRQTSEAQSARYVIAGKPREGEVVTSPQDTNPYFTLEQDVEPEPVLLPAIEERDTIDSCDSDTNVMTDIL